MAVVGTAISNLSKNHVPKTYIRQMSTCQAFNSSQTITVYVRSSNYRLLKLVKCSPKGFVSYAQKLR